MRLIAYNKNPDNNTTTAAALRQQAITQRTRASKTPPRAYTSNPHNTHRVGDFLGLQQGTVADGGCLGQGGVTEVKLHGPSWTHGEEPPVGLPL